MQLVQEIAAVALVTSDNFLPKIFNNWLCKMSNRGNMVNRQANDNDMESSINGNLSMGGSMLKQKVSKLGYVTLLCAQRSQRLFQERCNWSLLERDYSGLV